MGRARGQSTKTALTEWGAAHFPHPVSSAMSNAFPWLGHFTAAYFNFWLLGTCSPVSGTSLGPIRIMTLKKKIKKGCRIFHDIWQQIL